MRSPSKPSPSDRGLRVNVSPSLPARRGGIRVASSQRGYTAGRFLVELDGSAAGFVDSFEGGDVFSDVVVERIGADGIAHKHLAGVRYDDLALVVGANMSKSFF